MIKVRVRVRVSEVTEVIGLLLRFPFGENKSVQ